MDFIKFTTDLLKHHGLHEWKVMLDRAKTRAGKCSYKRHTIYLSKYYLVNATEDDVKDTILHEIAHALTPGHGHDAHWKSKALELGCSGNVRCSRFTQHQFHITCKCQNVNVYRHRVKQWIRDTGYCKKCESPVIIHKLL